MGGISSQYSCSTCSSFPSTAAVNQSRIKVRQDSPCQDLSYFSCPGATAASTAVPTSADYCTLLWQYYTIQFIQPPTSLSFPEEIWTPAALLEVLALIWAGIRPLEWTGVLVPPARIMEILQFLELKLANGGLAVDTGPWPRVRLGLAEPEKLGPSDGFRWQVGSKRAI